MREALSDGDARRPPRLLRGRRMLACVACGWVHYAMTAAEKVDGDRKLERYKLSLAERMAYESAFRQCLRCEAPVGEFREAQESDLARAASHLVTPVLADDA
jgi:hypothetical protein